jgi:hypothetical protein
MFTLEESALLARMLRLAGWTLVALLAAGVVGVMWLLAR